MCDSGNNSLATYETADELAVRLRLPNIRWLTDRLRPGHPERLPHHRFATCVFSAADAAAIEARYARNQVDGLPSPPAQFGGLDPLAIERGRRVLARERGDSARREPRWKAGP